MNNKISIITVVYNCEQHIEKTILSVINQTFKNIEYIIIDGASTDNTMQIVNKYKDKIDIIISEPDRGISDAFNKGILNSTGNWLYFLNSGDYLWNDNILNEISAYLNDNNNIVSGYVKNEIFTMPKKKSFKSKLLFYQTRIAHQATFVKKEVFNTSGLFDINDNYHMDLDFFYRALRIYNYKITPVDKIIAYYLPGGISSDTIKSTKLVYHIDKKYSTGFDRFYCTIMFYFDFFIKKRLSLIKAKLLKKQL